MCYNNQVDDQIFCIFFSFFNKYNKRFLHADVLRICKLDMSACLRTSDGDIWCSFGDQRHKCFIFDFPNQEISSVYLAVYEQYVSFNECVKRYLGEDEDVHQRYPMTGRWTNETQIVNIS